MSNLHNIDKSVFRNGEYVGYTMYGAHRIARAGKSWRTSFMAMGVPHTFTEKTLAAMSARLESLLGAPAQQKRTCTCT